MRQRNSPQRQPTRYQTSLTGRAPLCLILRRRCRMSPRARRLARQASPLRGRRNVCICSPRRHTTISVRIFPAAMANIWSHCHLGRCALRAIPRIPIMDARLVRHDVRRGNPGRRLHSTDRGHCMGGCIWSHPVASRSTGTSPCSASQVNGPVQ